MRDFRSLPELPPKPHAFQSLPRKSIAVSGMQLSYVEAGEGAPLLLIHGLMTSAYSFRYVASQLAKHYRVIALDLPGAGQSEAPQGLSQRPQELAEIIGDQASRDCIQLWQSSHVTAALAPTTDPATVKQ